MQTQGTERARNTLNFLRRQITTGAWPVGERIPIEPELTELLSVGRSTIREAVRSLASMGMLETLPGRGTFVRSSTPSSALLTQFLGAYTLEELLSYRRALDIEAAQQAALNRTPDDIEALEAAVSTELRRRHCTAFASEEEPADMAGRFHYLMFDAAQNRLLASLYAGITDRLEAPEHRERLTHGSDADAMQEEHLRIFDAIKRGDFIDAVHAMADHVDHDLVVVTSEDEIIPPLRRSASAQARIDEARQRKGS
ncbi:MAG: FadR family transcriptional regulator [Propionibacterium sp.]|nr:FadR family transcriptional regulator [Propionibacterium sp.]